MKPIENTTGVERATSTLLGTAAAAVATALVKKLAGKPKQAKHARRRPARVSRSQTATSAKKEVRHG